MQTWWWSGRRKLGVNHEPTTSPANEPFQFPSLYKYSATGEFIWRKDYDHGFEAVASRTAPAMDGNYWMIGGMRLWPSTPTFVMKVNAEGDSLWQRRYRYYYTDYSENIGLGITPTSDGGLVMSGSLRQGHQDPQPLLYSNWLIKLDEYGCLVPGCGSVGVQDYAMDLRQHFSVWPNPAQTGATINFRFDPPEGFASHGNLRAVLLDATGREVDSRSYSTGLSQFTLESVRLAPWIYHLHLTNTSTWLAGAKVVV